MFRSWYDDWGEPENRFMALLINSLWFEPELEKT